VTGVTVMEGRFAAADAIALLDDNDTIVLADQTFLTLTAGEFEDFVPVLMVAQGGAANLLITDIANRAELAATSLTDTFVVAGLVDGESATFSGLQTGDRIVVGIIEGLNRGGINAGNDLLEWNFSLGTLIYEIADEVSLGNETVELTLAGVSNLSYTSRIFTVNNEMPG
tara:strand:- start:769 stop:1278 length:510 start_codon:yes stop_codon:yes gene_type:complete